MKRLISIPLVFLLLVGAVVEAQAERIKDLTNVRGVRANQLIGYGIIMGLNGTGDTDKTTFTTQSVVAMLARNNVRVPTTGLKLKNVAAVMVTAELPAFSRVGNRIDVVVNSIGDAKSLVGGTLIVTPLKGHDGQVYAVAQGPIAVGGYSVGDDTLGEVKNHPTVARVPDGALVERELDVNLTDQQHVTFQLRDADFTTAARMAKVINMNLGGPFALARDSGTIKVDLPPPYHGRIVEFLALVERLEVTPDAMAKVVINERTGTIIMGQDVRIAPVAVAHGSITVTIKSEETAVPAAPLTPGEGQVQKNKKLEVTEEKRRMINLQGANLADIVEGLNRLGASPRDLITILQAIKRSGALRADVEVI